MGQLHVYLQEIVEKQVREAAAAQGKTISALVGEVLAEKFAPPSRWPEGFFESLKWHGDFPERDEEANPSILDLPDVKFD